MKARVEALTRSQLLEDGIQVSAADPCLNISWVDIIFTAHMLEMRFGFVFNSIQQFFRCIAIQRARIMKEVCKILIYRTAWSGSYFNILSCNLLFFYVVSLHICSLSFSSEMGYNVLEDFLHNLIFFSE